jgi:hypothetical protein
MHALSKVIGARMYSESRLFPYTLMLAWCGNWLQMAKINKASQNALCASAQKLINIALSLNPETS